MQQSHQYPSIDCDEKTRTPSELPRLMHPWPPGYIDACYVLSSLVHSTRYRWFGQLRLGTQPNKSQVMKSPMKSEC